MRHIDRSSSGAGIELIASATEPGNRRRIPPVAAAAPEAIRDLRLAPPIAWDLLVAIDVPTPQAESFFGSRPPGAGVIDQDRSPPRPFHAFGSGHLRFRGMRGIS